MVIYIWSDGTWCHKEDIEEYSWMSDDYQSLAVPEDWSDEQVEAYLVREISL